MPLCRKYGEGERFVITTKSGDVVEIECNRNQKNRCYQLVFVCPESHIRRIPAPARETPVKVKPVVVPPPPKAPAPGPRDWRGTVIDNRRNAKAQPCT